jgi:16S rRNA (guanine527-N7)-methyltransferase
LSARTEARAARLALDRMLLEEPLRLPDDFADAAENYIALLLDANARLNLTRVVEPEAVARLHLLDALSAVPLLDELAPKRALDLGSGGGVPGIVLALARPAVRWTLVDSVRRKVDELRGFVTALGVVNAEAIAARAEDVGREPAHREAYDLVTARACAPLPVLAELALPLLRIGGRLLAWKGTIGEGELAAGEVAAGLLGGDRPEVRPTGIEVLGGHRFVVVTKRAPTPPRYPRRAGEPARHPLGS